MAAGGGAEAVRQRFLKRGADPEIAPDSPRSVAAGLCSEWPCALPCLAWRLALLQRRSPASAPS